MRRTFQFQKFLDRLFLYTAVIFLLGILIDSLKLDPMLTKEHYFDCGWAFMTAVVFQIVFSTIAKNFKRTLEEDNRGAVHSFVSGTFNFFGVWLSMIVLRDIFQTQSEYPEGFHYGAGIAVLLALGLTLKDCFNNREL